MCKRYVSAKWISLSLSNVFIVENLINPLETNESDKDRSVQKETFGRRVRGVMGDKVLQTKFETRLATHQPTSSYSLLPDS